MKIFIDFDDVILDTKKLKEDMISEFRKLGISRKTFFELYEKSKEDDGGFRTYYYQKHLSLMSKKTGIAKNVFLKIFWGIIKNSSKYIFRDVVPFLENFKKEDVHLISYGKNKYQKTKIINSGLKNYFQKIIAMAAPKHKSIIKIIGKNKAGEKLYFIDDRVKFIEEVKKNVPRIKTFLLKRNEGRFKDKKTKYCDYEVKNLSQVLKIIKNGK
jgi:hypothetical protein